MDAAFLNELLECSVCLEQLDSTSRVLPCQHTFCKRCLLEIVQSKGELRCPECRTLVSNKVDELPVNIFLVRLLEGIKNKTPRKWLATNLCADAGTAPAGFLPLDLTMNTPFYNTFLPLPSKICCAKAIYGYDSTNASDLSFQKGDLINLLKRIDVNWYQGELKGKVGFVPSSYITLVTPLTPPTSSSGGHILNAYAKALYDFQITDKNSEEKDCLTFAKGEIITVMRRIDENWAEGCIADRLGIFPISFVEMNYQAKQVIKMITCTGTTRASPPLAPVSSSMSDQGSGSKTPVMQAGILPAEMCQQDFFANLPENKRYSLSALNLIPSLPLALPTSSASGSSEHRHSMEMLSDHDQMSPGVSRGIPISVATSSTTSSKAVEYSTTRRGPRKSEDHGPTFYVALYNYKPQKSDELELKRGEVYTVSERCQDGWFKGTSIKSGNQGVFPGNYVQPAAPSKGQQSNYYHAVTPQQGGGALSAGFANMRVSPMRPRSNPQLPLTALYGNQARSSEWPTTAPQPGYPTTFVDNAGTMLLPSPISLGNASSAHHSSSKGTSTTPASQYNNSAAAAARGNNAAAAAAAPGTTNWQANKLEFVGSGSSTLPSSQSSTSSVIPQHLSLIKRLTRHKSKSPPPALSIAEESTSAAQHIRSGSCPSSHSGSSGAPSSSGGGLHKKTASLDDTLSSSSNDLDGRRQQPTPLMVAEPFRCIVPYPPNSEYELELKVGDVVYVHKKRDDGWCKGTLQRTGRTGLFPASFVQSDCYADYVHHVQSGHHPMLQMMPSPSQAAAAAMFQCAPMAASTMNTHPHHMINPPQ